MTENELLVEMAKKAMDAAFTAAIAMKIKPKDFASIWLKDGVAELYGSMVKISIAGNISKGHKYEAEGQLRNVKKDFPEAEDNLIKLMK